MMIRAGILTQSITFYGRSDQRDTDYGSQEETFAEGITCRAAVKYVSGSEVVLSETLVNTAVVIFTIRYRSTIDEKMQIQWNGSRYSIRVIEHDDKKTVQKITATKIVN